MSSNPPSVSTTTSSTATRPQPTTTSTTATGTARTRPRPQPTTTSTTATGTASTAARPRQQTPRTQPTTTSQRIPSVRLAPASTRARGSAPQIPPFVSQFSPPGQRCEEVFGALDPVDRAAICGALTTADQNIGNLARAIGEYATSLIDDHTVRKRNLEEALEVAKQEKEDTGRVSAPTKEKVQEVAEEYVATDGKVQELEDKLEAYRQLPGIIGKYNEYFADLVATLQGARGAQQTGQGAPAPPASSAPNSPSVPLEPPASQSAQAGVGQEVRGSQGEAEEEGGEVEEVLMEEIPEGGKGTGGAPESQSTRVFSIKEKDFEESRNKRQQKREESQRSARQQTTERKRQNLIEKDTFDKLVKLMAEDNSVQKIGNLINGIAGDVELQNFMRRWKDIYSAIIETANSQDTAIEAIPREEVPQFLNSVRDLKRSKEQNIATLNLPGRSVVEGNFKNVLQAYLNFMYDRLIAKLQNRMFTSDKLKEVMNSDDPPQSKIDKMRQLIQNVKGVRTRAFLPLWLNIYDGISNTFIPNLSDITPDNARQIADSLTAVKARFNQEIGNLDNNTPRADEYKALLQNYLNSKYDPTIQVAQQMSAN